LAQAISVRKTLSAHSWVRSLVNTDPYFFIVSDQSQFSAPLLLAIKMVWSWLDFLTHACCCRAGENEGMPGVTTAEFRSLMAELATSRIMLHKARLDLKVRDEELESLIAAVASFSGIESCSSTGSMLLDNFCRRPLRCQDGPCAAEKKRRRRDRPCSARYNIMNGASAMPPRCTEAGSASNSLWIWVNQQSLLARRSSRLVQRRRRARSGGQEGAVALLRSPSSVSTRASTMDVASSILRQIKPEDEEEMLLLENIDECVVDVTRAEVAAGSAAAADRCLSTPPGGESLSRSWTSSPSSSRDIYPHEGAEGNLKEGCK